LSCHIYESGGGRIKLSLTDYVGWSIIGRVAQHQFE